MAPSSFFMFFQLVFNKEMVDEAIAELALLSLGRSLLHRRRTDRILVYGFAAVHLPVQDGHDGRQLAAVHHQALYDEDEAEPHGRDGQVQRTLRQVEQ